MPRLMLVDSINIHLRAVETDANGKFDFGNIPIGQPFRVIMPDSVINLAAKADLLLFNAKGEKVAMAKEGDIPFFNFTSLKAQEFYPDLMSVDDSEMDIFGLHGQVFRALPGDYHSGLSLMAIDDDGRIVETVYADSNGVFDFSHLKSGVNYEFKVAETNETNLNVSIFDLDGKLVAQLRLDEMSKYFYETLQSEEADRFKIHESDESMLSSDMVAGMIYKQLPGDYKPGMKVYAVDENGNILDSAYTDGEGNFRFERLKREAEFTLALEDSDDSELNIGFYGYDNKFAGMAKMDADNQFVYSKLVLEAAALLGEEEEEDLSELVFGQVFQKLPGDIEKGTKVYAYDEDGNIIDIAIVDENGKFEFKKLGADQAYSIRLDEEDITPTFALLDAQGNTISEQATEDGTWNFDKLAHDQYSMALIDANDAALDSEKYKPAKPIKNVAPSNAEIIYFDYRSEALTAEDSAILRPILASLEANADAFLRINSHIDPSETKGEWSYSAARTAAVATYFESSDVNMERVNVRNWEAEKLAIECSVADDCSESDRAKNRRSELEVVGADQFPTKPDGILMYEFNQWLLPPGSGNAVFGTIKLLKNNPDYSVEIAGFTDSYGSFTANNRISQLRATNIRNIFQANGIDESRIDLIWYGESSPQGGCITQYPCPLSERKANRRVEIRVRR